MRCGPGTEKLPEQFHATKAAFARQSMATVPTPNFALGVAIGRMPASAPEGRVMP
jgi:hypothetical protein